MTPDPTYAESYATFLMEAQDILKRIEQDLLSLGEDRSINRVHRLMRSAHTLKGAAASVEIETIKQVAHILEDIFKVLYNPDVVIDAEVESLLFEGYECLRLPIMVEVTGGQIDTQSILNRATAITIKLQEKLGDCFDRETPLPTSVELGFDVVQSMFEVTVGQRLQELEQTVNHGSLEEVQSELWAKADMFSGLAESLELPGFGAIAQATQAALEAYPEQALMIAQLALKNFSEGRSAVLAGDRTQGGSPSSALQALTQATLETSEFAAHEAEIESIESEIESGINVPVIEQCDTEFESWSLDELFGQTDTVTNAVPSSPTQTIQQSEPQLNSGAAPAQPPTSGSASYVSPAVASTELPRVELPRAEPVRVDVEQLQSLDYLAGELLINQSKQTSQDQQFRVVVQALRSSLRQHEQTIHQLQDKIEQLLSQAEWEKSSLPVAFTTAAIGSGSPWNSPNSVTAAFDALEMERYDDLRVLLRSALNETVQLDDLTENVDQLTKQSRRTLEVQRRLMSQVRDDLAALRMYPLRDLLNRFPRLLQQLANAHGKPAQLILSGTCVLVDKTVAEKLYDPLLHLIRNAFDHGIEPPDVRQIQGKPDVGRIEIRANQQGNQTVIEVKDDGRGIDLQRVAQRAIELNLIPPEQVHTIPESQLLDLLFQPGFSTATHLSDLSGRGIGLDVVNSQLQALKGSIAISTTPQQGTTFTLKIPLSLTTTKLLVCHAQGFAYALPVERVEQIVVPLPNQLHVLGDEQVVMHWQQGQEKQVVPIYALSDLVHYAELSASLRSSASTHPSITTERRISLRPPQAAPVLLLQTIYGLRGLSVDQVLGEQELVIRSLGAAITPPPYVYGCCILGNSRSALAIDVEVLMQLTTAVESLPESLSLRFNSTLSETALPLPVESHPIAHQTGLNNLRQLPRSKTILIVDDSLTLRHQLALLLKDARYTVLQAGNGLEALTQLRHHTNLDFNIDLIICDLEMPTLNGFEFLNQAQQDPTLKKIPVVVLTSRSSAKHRQIALTLGATAYFTKPYDPAELLMTLDRLLQDAVPQ